MQELVDVWRVLVLSGVMVVLAFTVLVVLKYGLLSRRRTPLRDHFVAHVFYVSLSFAVLLLMIAFDQVERIGTPMTWRLPSFSIAVVLAIVGVSNLWDHVSQGRTQELNEP